MSRDVTFIEKLVPEKEVSGIVEGGSREAASGSEANSETNISSGESRVSFTVRSGGGAETETARDRGMPEIDEGRLKYTFPVTRRSERAKMGSLHRHKDAAWFFFEDGYWVFIFIW